MKILLLKKTGYFDFGIDTIFDNIHFQLERLNRELRNYYCNNIRPIQTSNHALDFELGDAVKTTNVESIQNYREGIIYAIEHHVKEQMTYYHIRIRGIVHNRKYRKEELTLNEYHN